MKEYKFGPHNPHFTGSPKQWNKLKEKVAKWETNSSLFPGVCATCPHCGSKNSHSLVSMTQGHRACDAVIRNAKGHVISSYTYDCPGYCIYLNDEINVSIKPRSS